MAKTQKPNEDEKIVKENVQKRFKDMFTGENEPPTNMSLKEVEALKARIGELEAKLANQQAAPPDNKVRASTGEPFSKHSSGGQAEKHSNDPSTNLASAMLEKTVRLWVVGIMAVIGLLFFGAALYILFIVQGGIPEVSDKILTPLIVVITAGNIVSFLLIRRDRTVPGAWIAYLMNVIVPAVMLVLIMENMYIMGGMYLAIFFLIFAALVMPKPLRLQATILAVGAALVITGIEVWHPGFRDTTNRIQNVTSVIGGTAVLGILAVFLIARQIWSSRIGSGVNLGRRSLVTTLTIVFFSLSVVLLLIAGGISAVSNYLSYQETLSARQLIAAQEASRTVANSIQEKFSVLETVTGLNNPVAAPAEVRENTLSSLLGVQPAFQQVALLDTAGRQASAISRQSLSLSQQFESQLKGGIFAQTSAGHRYISAIYIDELTSEPLITIAVPVRDVFGDFQGSLVAELNLKFMWELVDQLEIGETGYAYVVDDKGNLIAFQDTARVLRGENVQQIPEVSEFVKNPFSTNDITQDLVTYTGIIGETVVGSYVPLGTPQWAVVTELPVREAYQPIVRTFSTFGTLILLFAILVGLAGSVLARRLSNPLIELSRIATQIAGGDMDVQAKITGPSEIAQLAASFNAMTSQIRELVGTLEQRVADRTHDLELAAEVGRTVTGKTTRVSEMLAEATEIIRARFDLYYTQVYLTDPSEERLTLRAGTGEVGKELLRRGHFLVINSASLNGRAVTEKRAQIVADTSENPTFRPNVLLPNTRSEMAIPLIVDEKVVGVLDMQSEQPGALSESNLSAFQALAGQLAIAVRNAALLAEAQEARAEVETQIGRFTEQGWENFLDAVQREHRIGFVFGDSKVTRLESQALLSASKAKRLNLPIMVTGAKVGEIQLPPNLKSSEVELVSAISEQLAQHIENLRLLAQAEKFQKEAEQALRRMLHEGWETYLSTGQMETGYVYDLNQVQPLTESNSRNIDPSYKQPLVIRDETIGELRLDLPEVSSEASEILASVAQQLSDHIETLRLSEINERHAQREKTLREITSALRNSTNPATILRTAVRELGKTLGRRTVVQLVPSEPVELAASAPGNGSKTDSPVDPS